MNNYNKESSGKNNLVQIFRAYSDLAMRYEDTFSIYTENTHIFLWQNKNKPVPKVLCAAFLLV